MFYAIPNLRASSAFALEKPWEFVPAAPPPYEAGKDALITWSSEVTTEHAFISAFEGMSELVRVTDSDNPPFKMHGLIADYDLQLPDNPLEFLLRKAPSEFLPSWMVTTASGNARLVWLFERPLLCSNKTHMKEFVKQIARHVKLGKWLGGLETEALTDYSKYYELGKLWTPVPKGSAIRTIHLESWFIKAAEGLRFDDKKHLEYHIPIEDLAREVDARFPGKWQGPFVAGARGVRFWDGSADNDTASVVTAEGMLCFTGAQSFVPWRQIFGAAFVEQYEADYVAGIIDDTAYDGRSFWLQDNGQWTEWSKEDFSQELRVRGYEARKKPGKPASEVDIIENAVKKQRRVDKALPFLYYPTGIINYQRFRYLNMSRTRVTQPAPPITPEPMSFADGRTHFPLIYKVLRTMFVENETEESEQLVGLLAWMKYFYVNSYEHTPKPGHAVVLAGPAGKGKTLFARGILGGLMGGESDASSHLVDGDIYTERLIDSPVMRIDDSLAVSDQRGLLKFSGRIKKYVANSEILYNQKYCKAGQVPWFGRIIITCNLDAESLRILPDMDISSRDKISLFRASDHIVKFPDWYAVEKSIKQELPAFARFLIDWNMPEDWVASELRFGVKAYHHPELFEESRQQGHGIVLELLTGFLAAYEGRKDMVWEGTATQLYADLAVYNPEVTKEFRVRGISTALGQLAKNGYNLVKYAHANGNQVWRIGKDLLHKEVPVGE